MGEVGLLKPMKLSSNQTKGKTMSHFIKENQSFLLGSIGVIGGVAMSIFAPSADLRSKGQELATYALFGSAWGLMPQAGRLMGGGSTPTPGINPNMPQYHIAARESGQIPQRYRS